MAEQHLDLIDRQALLAKKTEMELCFAVSEYDIANAPRVDAVEIPDKEMLRAVKLLLNQYEHSKNSDYVHSPVAHAFFHTWKQLDERREL